MIGRATLLPLLGAVALSALGQVLLKAGAQHLDGRGGHAFLLAAARDPRVLAGLVAWGGATACWLHVLRAAPLSRAYLLSSLTYVLVPLAGVVLFGESLRRVQVVGMALVLAGVVCLLAGE